MTPGGARAGLWLAAGLASLVLLAGFIAVALAALLLAGGSESGWPPLAYLWRVTGFTLLQALASTLLSVLLALPAALAIARRASFPGRSLIMGLMLLPLGLPVLPAVFGIVEIWGRQGMVNQAARALGLPELPLYGLAGILIAHVFFNLPLATRLMVGALDAIPRDEWRLAASLDLPRFALFRSVEWPALARVIPGAASLIFMLCVTSFTIILTLGGGPQSSTLEVAIYQALKFDYDPARALALTALQLGLTLVIFLGLRLLPDPDQDRGARQGRAFRSDGRSALSRLADGAVILAFLLFVGAPLGAVLAEGMRSDLMRLVLEPAFRQALSTSLIIAIVAGLASTVLSLAMLQAGWRRRGHADAALFRLPEFLLLLPPLALGSGWFVLMLRTGLERQAAVPVVIAVNMLMAMPFAVRVLGPPLRTHLIRTERLADSLGMTGWSRWRLIDWPVLRAPLAAALGFSMALSLGDLGAVALFGSEDFVTLPALLYAKLGSYRSTDAAGLALLLGLICILLMWPAMRSPRTAGGAA